MTATPDDEAAIRAVHDELTSAWSEGNVDAVMSLFAEDAVRVGVAGDVQHGRAEIRVAMERVLTQVFRGATIRAEPGSLRWLSADTALWRGGIEILPAGAPAPLKGHSVEVFQKRDGQWLIVETHPKLFPTAEVTR